MRNCSTWRRASLSKSLLVSRIGLWTALGIAVPFLFHQFGIAGKVFLPMHFPVFLAGLLCGPWAGFWVGVLSPSLSFLLTGMPPFPFVLAMVPELTTYGTLSGWLYSRGTAVVPALLGAMVLGRCVLGLAMWVLSFFLRLHISPLAFVAGAVLTGLPGTAAQLSLIPVLVKKLDRGHP
ncbi:MAG TPA: ECF transporter S component [Candidatus Latescibacteria bacterium]|nr:ECF transporter S component [Candidatus Latescibacterota bacterium]